MGETIEAIGYKSDVKARAKDSVSEKVETVKSKLTGVTEKAADSAPSGEDVQQTARRAAGIAKENPIGLALGGVAVGFLAGMAIPSTRVEDEKIGAVSSQMKQQAKETGQEALEHGKEVAQETMEGAKEAAQHSAEEHGEQLKQSAQGHAERATQNISA
jgi:hypothetical protein